MKCVCWKMRDLNWGVVAVMGFGGGDVWAELCWR